MRPKIDAQCELEFPVSKLALTQQYYAKYQAISKILDQVPEILTLAHGDLKHALEQVAGPPQDGARFRYTSDRVLSNPCIGASSGGWTAFAIGRWT